MATTHAALAVTKLEDQEILDLAGRHPEIAGHDAAVVVTTDDAELLRQAMAIVDSMQRRRQQMEQMIESMMPTGVPGKAAVLQAQRNAEAREALLRDFGALTSAEVADLAGSKAANRAALANRWRKEGRIFAVTHRGQTLFVSFQLDADGRPLPVIAQVLEAFGGDEGWQTALWFLAGNGWLGDSRPIDLLISEPERVAEAARREAAAFVF
ncbi:MAG: hypothetical protein GY719_35555 [bacterium]|nr:hypothetical protein [bacterium]